jgi:hypothetical protein
VEIVMQWLDELDDLVATLRLMRERIRNFLLGAFFLAVTLLALSSGILLALRHPPIALATAMILFVTLLYRAVTTPRTPQRHAA